MYAYIGYIPLYASRDFPWARTYYTFLTHGKFSLTNHQIFMIYLECNYQIILTQKTFNVRYNLRRHCIYFLENIYPENILTQSTSDVNTEEKFHYFKQELVIKMGEIINYFLQSTHSCAHTPDVKILHKGSLFINWASAGNFTYLLHCGENMILVF